MSTLIKEFDQICSELESQKIISRAGHDFWTFGNKPKHLLSILIHGNETLGISLINDFLNKIKSKEKVTSFGFLLGNRQAGLANKRFIGRDLNRSFLTESNDHGEEKRAKEIQEYSKQFEFILDIHQTSHTSEKEFFLCRNHSPSLEMAEIFHESPLVFLKEAKMSSEGEGFGSFCLEESIHFLTVELGKMGFQQNFFDLGKDIINKFLKYTGKKKEINLSRDSYVFSHTIHKRNESDHLIPGLVNFQKIKKGTALLQDGTGISPIDGYTLFPKYGEYQKFSKDLCQILEKKKLEDVI